MALENTGKGKIALKNQKKGEETSYAIEIIFWIILFLILGYLIAVKFFKLFS